MQEFLKIYAESIGIEESKIEEYSIRDYIKASNEAFKDLANLDIDENIGKLTEKFKLAFKR